MCKNVSLILLFVGCNIGCASSNTDLVAPVEEWEVEILEEIAALKRAVEAAYDRERALVDRLQASEESGSSLERKMEKLGMELTAMRSRLRDVAVPPAYSVRPSAAFEVVDSYQTAWQVYSERRFDEAVELFAEVVLMAPENKLADNAQYWMGECYYGMGKFAHALTEFTKVFAYHKTEKDDDAQLMIGRCYQAMGEVDRASAAFQRLIEDFPNSEYLDSARRELN